MISTDYQSTKLSRSCTVSKYLALQDAKDRNTISDFVVERFEERYLDPIDGDTSRKNGFTIMAVSYLMIESIESFRLGLKSTRGRSERTFGSFFAYWDQFAAFRDVSGGFYQHVRCGILHQAETTGGWRIIRTGPLRAGTTVNASKFFAALRLVLKSYAASLRTEDWESETWRAFRAKMSAVCTNTRP